MREGPPHRDPPFGQMIFPETCQLLCAAAVAIASEIQRQLEPLRPSGLTSNTGFSEAQLPTSFFSKHFFFFFLENKSPARTGELRGQKQPSG